jgi:hypothetical protein
MNFHEIFQKNTSEGLCGISVATYIYIPKLASQNLHVYLQQFLCILYIKSESVRETYFGRQDASELTQPISPLLYYGFDAMVMRMSGNTREPPPHARALHSVSDSSDSTHCYSATLDPHEHTDSDRSKRQKNNAPSGASSNEDPVDRIRF